MRSASPLHSALSLRSIFSPRPILFPRAIVPLRFVFSPRPAASLRRLALAASLFVGGISAASAGASHALATDLVARFDALVAGSLPGSLALDGIRHTGPGSEGHASPKRLDITSRLDVGVTFPGDVEALMYLGTLDGQPAVVTRVGSRLDVSVSDADGIRVAGFVAGSDEASHFAAPAAPHAPLPVDQPLVDQVLALPTPAPTSARAGRSRRASGDIDPPATGRFEVHVFTHDDVSPYLTREQIHAGYVSWWLADMLTTTAPFIRLHVNFHAPIHGVTDIPYRYARALVDWTGVAQRWAESEDIAFYGTHQNKFILLTLVDPVPGVTGIAWQEGNAALASVGGRYRIVAHELGHLFGAQHGDADIRFKGGWWCESNMYPSTSSFRSNCYGYTTANQRRIRAHLVEGRRWNDEPNRGPAVIGR